MNKSRKTGFDCPPHLLQVLAWILEFATIFVFYFFIVPIQSLLNQILMSVLFGIFQLAFIYHAFLLTKSDPTDSTLRQKPRIIRSTDAYLTYCSLCVSEVSNDSKHCMKCNRCVSKFDHHCNFVNNCIGKCNYWIFIKVIILLEMMEVIFLVCCSYVIYIWNFDSNHIKDVINGIYGDNSEFGLIIACWILGVLSLIILLANGYLISLHVWLITHKITTYELICKKRLKKTGFDSSVNIDSDETKIIPSALTGSSKRNIHASS
ncbi:unnamed protein product [Blepharisma stoltei]|uniref:Palmitoyltransferase n=1 Tax=Blepharisma stoltei TaxID=1481888 RepID=A0AAU9IPL5_9CILI|nr:unnamed protein product [Blepharisma stoltei]